ncbi:MAG TPA: transposase family protein [Thermoanaerobaculia bacterium]|nr:transposase family protein [Thermoanaerobaculia bacterium]
MLVRAGKKLSTETVRRYRKNPVLLPAPAPSQTPKRDEPGVVLRAKEANHIWMTDITDVPSFLRIWIFKLVVILDVYSRFPLAFKVFPKEPTSEEIALLVENALHRYGAPKHFVTDRGSQFTGLSFMEKLRTLGMFSSNLPRDARSVRARHSLTIRHWRERHRNANRRRFGQSWRANPPKNAARNSHCGTTGPILRFYRLENTTGHA